MPSLIIGDLHFDDKPPGMMEAQKQAIISICKQNPKCDKVVFLGDLMMHRNPRPTVLLALKEMLDYISEKLNFDIYILRGNHDSVTKADDGVTSLSLFNSPKIKVITQSYVDEENKWIFIPHYENETVIKDYLVSSPDGYTCFGHFGYFGVLNSAGDSDFSLSISDFKNPTILGHIHKFGQNKNVTVIGTPYTTSFTEAGKECFYGILEQGTSEIVPTDLGPKHTVIDYDNLEDSIPWINANLGPDRYTLLRIVVNTINQDPSHNIAALEDKIKAPYIEVKYKPLLDDEESFTTGTNPVFNVLDTEVIDHYISSSNTSISKDELLAGLSIIYENQQGRNQ